MTATSPGLEATPPAEITLGPWGEIARGWRIILATIIAIFICILPSYSFSVFVGPLSKAFNKGPAEITIWMFCWSAGCVCIAPFVGAIADKLGARRVLLAGLPIYGLTLIGTAMFTPTFTMLLVFAALVGATSLTVSAIIGGRLISRYFDRGLGTALGLMSSGIGLGAIFGPSILQRLVDAHSWQFGYQVMAAATFIAWPILWFLTIPPAAEVKRTEAAAPAIGFTLKEALAKPLFWAMAVGSLAFGVAIAGPAVNMVGFLTSTGMTRAFAAGLMGGYGLFTFAGRTLTGIAIDRIPMHIGKVMTLVMTVMGASFLLIGFGGQVGILAGIAVLGFFVGAETDCLSYCTVRVFGRRAFGSIYAVLGIVMLYIGTGTGGFLFASTVGAMGGSYHVAFAVWAGIAALSGGLFLVAARAPYLAGTSH